MRAASTAILTTVLLLAAPAAIAASPPGTPHVTVGADIKQLIFDWDDAVGAGYYRLLYKVGSGAFKPLIDNIPASTTQVKVGIAVHLQSWSLIRYAVAACNTSGCTNSAAIFPQNLMLDTIGYFKASNTDPDDEFGSSFVLSDDGRTLAVVASSEDSNASGVNGNQADNSSSLSGAVYVFHRTSSGWRQEAYLKAGTNQPEQALGAALHLIPSKALAINANGSLLAVGAPWQDLQGNRDVGVVYIYQKSSSGSWSVAATLSSPTPQQFDDFGSSVDMSLDGRTLKVSQVGPYVDLEEGIPQFRTHIFIRVGTTWKHSVTFAGFFAGDACNTTRLSGDGNTLVLSCNNYVSSSSQRVETYKRSVNTWTHVSDLPLAQASNIALALNVDATTMALQEIQGTQSSVGIYRWTGEDWLREKGIGAPPTSTLGTYGRALALTRTGNMLAIGDPFAREDGAGVSPGSMPGSEYRGAVYVWRRDDRNPLTWILRSVIKSPNPGYRDYFGDSIAICNTGHALAVGAEGEDSKAKGVDGDRTDNSSKESGAVYLY